MMTELDVDVCWNLWSEMQSLAKPIIGTREYDEVAVAYATFDEASNAALDFVLAQKGIFFNMSRDTAWFATDHPQPQDLTFPPLQWAGKYEVSYRFLQPTGVPFRIEAMSIDSGISPAHIDALEALDMEEDGACLPMHVSYKPSIPGIAGYEAEKLILGRAGFIFVQECLSTYGAFSYWRHPDIHLPVYLKPRVNLRDKRRAEHHIEPVRMSDGWSGESNFPESGS